MPCLPSATCLTTWGGGNFSIIWRVSMRRVVKPGQASLDGMVINLVGMQLLIDPLVHAHGGNAVHLARARTEAQPVQGMQRAFLLVLVRKQAASFWRRPEHKPKGRGSAAGQDVLIAWQVPHSLYIGLNPELGKSCRNEGAGVRPLSGLQRLWQPDRARPPLARYAARLRRANFGRSGCFARAGNASPHSLSMTK